jgi:hypothetical protein
LITPREMAKLLSRVVEISEDSGTATSGSQTTIEDTGKNWATDMWANAVVHVIHIGIEYVRLCSSNTADTLTIAALPTGISVAAEDSYAIRRPVTAADISDRAARLLGVIDSLTKWGGTALTGRDISQDLAKLDVALSTRATEATLAKIIPIAKAALFNTALPAAEANWLGADITPTNSLSYLRITVCISVPGLLRVARTQGGTTITENLNSGGAITANALYTFDVPWRTGDSINIRYSVTTGTIKLLIIDEFGGAV